MSLPVSNFSKDVLSIIPIYVNKPPKEDILQKLKGIICKQTSHKTSKSNLVRKMELWEREQERTDNISFFPCVL